MALRTLSLFTGGGGLDLGLRLAARAGATPPTRTVCYIEIEAYAVGQLTARFEDGLLDPAPVWSDVRSFYGGPWRGAVDLVVGGFPCTDISLAGKQAGLAGAASSLWDHMARIIEEVEPAYVLAENVGALVSAKGRPPVCACGYTVTAGRVPAACEACGGPLGGEPDDAVWERALGTVLRDLAALGFDAECCDLSAGECGAPHERRRMWILGAWPGRDRLADPDGRREPEVAGADDRGVADPGEPGLQGRGDAGSTAECGFPALIPPGPADADGWAAILRIDEALAPALPRRPQSNLRGVADGLAARMERGLESRNDRLRLLGNGVHPACCATAFAILWRRMIEG